MLGKGEGQINFASGISRKGGQSVHPQTSHSNGDTESHVGDSNRISHGAFGGRVR